MTQKVIENLNRLITSKETKSVIKKSLKNKSAAQDGFMNKFYQIFEE